MKAGNGSRVHVMRTAVAVLLIFFAMSSSASIRAASSFAWSSAKTVTVGNAGWIAPGLSFETGRTGLYSTDNDLEVEQNLPNVFLTTPSGGFIDLGVVPFDSVPPLNGDLTKKLPATSNHVYLFFRDDRVVRFQIVRIVKGELQYSLPAVTITYATGTLDPSQALPDASTYDFSSPSTGSNTTGGQTPSQPQPQPQPQPQTSVGTPTNVKAVFKDGAVQLTWQAASPAPSKGYYVYQSTQPTFTPKTPVMDFPVLSTSYVDTKVSPNATYYYVIEAIGGGFSQVVEIKTEPPVVDLTIPTEERVVQLQRDSKVAYVNHLRQVLDVAPQLIQDRMMVPLRILGEGLGAQIGWDDGEQRITYQLGNRTLYLWVGNPVASLNGQSLRMDVPPTVVESRTLIPLRFVTENLGATVEWNTETFTATITYKLPAQAAPQPAAPIEPEKPAQPSIPFGTFALRLPGAVWTFDVSSTASNLYIGAGTPTKSWITLREDGTYEWGSAWDGKIYTGNWEPNNSTSIIIRGAQEGRDWLVDRTVPAQGVDDEINLYSSTHYYGKLLGE